MGKDIAFFDSPLMVYDIIISGGGAAGLSMLAHLLSSNLRDQKILLIDLAEDVVDQKTWCFWDENPPDFYKISHSWQAVSVKYLNEDLHLPLGNLKYYEIENTVFHHQIHEYIKGFSNVSVIYDRVLSTQCTVAHVEVICTNNNFRGKLLINSIPNLARQKLPSFTLTQNFLGWKIKTKNPCFDPATVTLMDFQSTHKEEVSFFYVLPFSKTEALVEFTRLSSSVDNINRYEEEIRDYLSKKFDVEEFDITYQEFGVIPMTNFAFDRRPEERIFQIGTVGNDTKPTTGYTFKNIQRHCSEIVSELSGKNQRKKSTGRFRFYDRLLLQIIKKHPEEVPAIMFALFSKNDIHLIMDFLDERTSLKSEIKIFWQLPWKPFLRELFTSKMKLYAPEMANSQYSDYHRSLQAS